MSSIIEMKIEQACESKAAFIQFIVQCEFQLFAPWAFKWLEDHFTDEMAHNFLRFYNGSVDDNTMVLPSGEVLPSLVDDIEECMRAYWQKKVQTPSFIFNPEPLNNDLQLGLSLN